MHTSTRFWIEEQINTVDLTHTHLSTACRMCLIHAFLSSLVLVWTSYISGPTEEAEIRNIPRSSLATSLTMSFCRGITGGFWSWKGRYDPWKWVKGWRESNRELHTKCCLLKLTTAANTKRWSFSCRKTRTSVSKRAKVSTKRRQQIHVGWKSHKLNGSCGADDLSHTF